MKTAGLLIDWLTLRIPLSDKQLGFDLHQRVMNARMHIQCFDSEGVKKWEKASLDFDALRSDTVGLCWMMQGDGVQYYLVIGGSPASLNHGLNVFGDLDIRAGAETLIRAAQRGLQAILPPLDRWQCRRIDITGNYLLPDASSVKQALRMLMNTDAARRRATSAKRGGDTVMWNTTSDLTKGKAYHKGPQLLFSCRRHNLDVTPEQIEMADRLLRLEHTRGARWFRREEEDGRRWQDLTSEKLEECYLEFFERLVEGVEVKDMDRMTLVELIQNSNNITEGRAEAAFTTYRNIRADGLEVVKGFMAKSTFYRHLRYLRNVGITDSDLYNSNVFPIRPVRIVLAQPVSSWEDIRRVA
ncbi:MAG: phage/plasmid replication protein, II/X family [Zoogloeaceae bacterium]|jgi:II/X family phage/plasmid replication protein|nr:phage/plasmid replication protein, II/X family [Zoogloeaceae bacterium]